MSVDLTAAMSCWFRLMFILTFQWPGYPRFNRVVNTVVGNRQISRLEMLSGLSDAVKAFFTFVQVCNVQSNFNNSILFPGVTRSEYTPAKQHASPRPRSIPPIRGAGDISASAETRRTSRHLKPLEEEGGRGDHYAVDETARASSRLVCGN